MPLLRVFLLFLCFSLSLPALAQSELDTAINTVRDQLEALTESGGSEAERRELQEIYQSTLSHLQRQQQLDKEQAELDEQLDEAPARMSATRRQIDQISVIEADTLRQQLENLPLSELEDQLSEKVARMFAWQNELTRINSELIGAQTRPERTQANVSANQTREQAISEQIRSLQRQPASLVRDARIAMLRAETASLQRANELMRQRLNANNVLQELASHERDLLNQQTAVIDMDIQVLQDVIHDKRLSASEQAVDDVSLAAESSDHQLLREQGSLNRQLSESLLRATTQISELTRKNIQTRQQIDSLTQVDRALEQQISVLEGSLLLSRILHQQKRTLPRVDVDHGLPDRIADLRLRQFELNQLREELTHPEAYLQRLLDRLPAAQQEQLRNDLEVMITNRVQLVEQLGTNINNLLSQAITLQISQRQLQQLSSDLQRTIDDQLFWVASSRPIDRNWLQSLPQQLSQQWEQLQPLTHLRQIPPHLIKQWPGLIGLGLLLAIYLLARPRINSKLQTLHADVGHFRRDTTRHTPLALLLTLFRVSIIPLLLAGCGLLLMRHDGKAIPAFGIAALYAALAWLVLHLLYRVFDNQGIAERHFRWEADRVSRLHRLTKHTAFILLPLVVIVALGEHSPEVLDADAIGRLLMISCLLVLGGLLGNLMRRTKPLYSSRVIHSIATLALALTPVILAGMSFWGYHYTAIKLADRFIDTLYVIVLWLLLDGTAVRNLNVAGRRLAYQRALSKRENSQANDQTDQDMAVEVPKMDLQQINQQSLRLAKLSLMLVFGVVVYLIWSDLLSAATYLNSFTLWQYNSGSAEFPNMVPISVADVLGALIIVVLTITLARNLPGLLEILLLSKLKLQQGSSYAITTLLSYVIVSIGIIVGLSTLGVSWDKLQWLVAALSVGLGFGLQEIFANFVSGIILLFERPIRIGDVVTIGNLSGTVNRIRIRATTISDFDRKEIIVPNKTFVTSHLVNWSLSDTVTRVILKLGVAYNSDLAKIKQLLLQITHANERVLADPEPEVLFLNFGESTLDHELRYHVGQLGDRNPSIDEINREVDRLFRENGIEIAFRQLDVYLRNSDGVEKLIESRKV
ncbi:mechanosensitive channel MscK [Halopseudomonas salegens]|uniref:Potassium efflux system protein n=1 Tax=Halopseudomonas salegens TaxID=1434072 RepID=A0A1H2EAN5_9GAMM|nr:mechanosensitive channel MscK [Halopseudomonas salegens]SDT92069.1 potassium efflux system protein [Halopseudomonas salegens]